MQIRQATQEDLPALMALVRRVVPLMRAAGNLQWGETYPNNTVFQRDIDLGQLWIAEVNLNIAGVAAITMDQEPDYAQVGWNITEPAIVTHRLAVDPAFRGQGAAGALMQKAEEIALERGVTVFLSLATSSPARSPWSSDQASAFSATKSDYPQSDLHCDLISELTSVQRLEFVEPAE
jgi:GNAT superfamily N-acetyltransferase